MVRDCVLRLVSLPRLKLTFQAIRVGEAVRLHSVDPADLLTLTLTQP